MIVTKSWLSEWIDLSKYGADEICKTFNATGLEVDRVESFRVPEKIVVGYVQECEKHPDATKLNVCKVDTGSGIRQIVCGASNVRAGIYIAVAMIGCVMPNGMEIKPVQLRGVDSEGMICSSTELGLPKINDGIMILDESIGKLVLGKEIREYQTLNDDLIEIELTANRGDCLSIQGVARELSASYDLTLKKIENYENEHTKIGVGRILNINHESDENVGLLYKAFIAKEIDLPLLLQLRLAMIEEEPKTTLDAFLFYSTYTTGVVLRAYSHKFFQTDNTQKANILISSDENNLPTVLGKEKASTIGIIQAEESRVTAEDETIILEASYICPEVISKKVSETKIKTGPNYYRTSRGSEPTLHKGTQYFEKLLNTYTDVEFYAGTSEFIREKEVSILSLNINSMNALIGQEVSKMQVVQLLQKLGFGVEKSQESTIVVTIPKFRHDIVNEQDVTEEVVRLIGIDNITSKPFEFFEKNQVNTALVEYKKKKHFRHAAVTAGFYESIHYVFNEKKNLEKYAFAIVNEEIDILNPIVETMDTLRTTLFLGLLEAASRNVKYGKKSVPLFEIGRIFDANRHESHQMAFIFSGNSEEDNILNQGKPKAIDFTLFVEKIAAVLGDIDLVNASTSHTLSNPYQCANILKDGIVIGQLFKLHNLVAKEYDLEDTFLCEINFDLLNLEKEHASAFSKYQLVYRDLSVVVDKTLKFETIKEALVDKLPTEVQRYYPVDLYTDEALADKMSLSLRFVLQSLEKTLEEEDIVCVMDTILENLKESFGAELR